MNLFIVAAVFALILLFDFFPHRKSMSTKEKISYFSFMLLSFCVLFLYAINITVPSPSNFIISSLESLIPTLKQN